MNDVAEVWSLASRFDTLLSPSLNQIKALGRLRVLPVRWSRARLFSAIAAGHPFLAKGFRVPVAKSADEAVDAAIAKQLTRVFAKRYSVGSTIGVQVGPSRTRRQITVAELLRRWRTGRHIVSVTDLHVRGTALERLIDTTALSAFNLLLLGSEGLRLQEMMTMVISSRGNVTDSHSDDPDGSNHCFTGRKLWLAWDTFEGQRAGLQDCSRDMVHHQGAKFSLSTFLKLPSACWWTVEPGQTLFLPGRLTHRVVTLDRYMGIGSFYCTPASVLENLSRWYGRGALWALEDPAGENSGLVDEIAELMVGSLSPLALARQRDRRAWGLDFARFATESWAHRVPWTERRDACKRHRFAQVHKALVEAVAE